MDKKIKVVKKVVAKSGKKFKVVRDKNLIKKEVQESKAKKMEQKPKRTFKIIKRKMTKQDVINEMEAIWRIAMPRGKVDSVNSIKFINRMAREVAKSVGFRMKTGNRYKKFPWDSDKIDPVKLDKALKFQREHITRKKKEMGGTGVISGRGFFFDTHFDNSVGK